MCAHGVWGGDDAIEVWTKCIRRLEEETEELGEDAYREWNTGMLVPAGPGWSWLVPAGPGWSRLVPAVDVERPGLFLCLLHGVIITFFSLCVDCQDRISLIPWDALELGTPLLPLPSGWAYRGTSPPLTAIEQLLPQRRNKGNNSHSQAPPLPKSSALNGHHCYVYTVCPELLGRPTCEVS